MRDIIEQICEYSNNQYDVNVIVGDNGSGKSTLLGDIARWSHNNNKNTIVISNSIHDKFPIYRRNFHALKDKHGRKKTKLAFRNIFKSINEDSVHRLKAAMLPLEYTGYDKKIGVELSGFNPSDENMRSLRKDNYAYKDLEDLISLIYKVENSFNNTFSSEFRFWLSMDDFSFDEINRSIYTRLISHETLLRRYKIISDLNFYLSKKGEPIQLFGASSGELNLITSLVFIASSIDENTTIIIDEPENSLHPKWQREYVVKLLDNFYKYKPKIILATHSPLLLNGTLLEVYDTRVFKSKNFECYIHDHKALNIEESFADYFDIITPENRFLTSALKDLLNHLNSKKITRNEFNKRLEEFNDESYDPKQEKLFSGISQIADQISEL